MNEKKREWRQTVAHMLKHLLAKYPISDEFKVLPGSNEFFEDSRNFSDLRVELNEFKNFLLNLNRYEDICKDL